MHLKKAFRVLWFVVSLFFTSCQFRGNSLTRMYRVAGLKCLTHIYTGFYTSRDKGSLMKLLPLDLCFPKCKLMKLAPPNLFEVKWHSSPHCVGMILQRWISTLFASQIFTVLCNAYALCNMCHLQVLKTVDSRIAEHTFTPS